MTEKNNDIYKLLIEKGIVEKGHFILRSGKHSDTYIRKTLITLYPDLYNSIMYAFIKLIMSKLSPNDYDIITAPAVAGICFAAPIATGLNKPLVFTEKLIYHDNSYDMLFRSEFKKHIKNKRVIIIKDVIITGGSVIKVIESIKNNGGYPLGAFCLLNRNPEMTIIRHENIGPKIKNKISTCYDFIHIHSLISKKIEDWETASDCPMCKNRFNNKTS